MQKFSKFQKSLFTSTLYKFQGALEGILAPIFHVHKHKKSDELQQTLYFLTPSTKILGECIWLSIVGNFHDLNLLSMMTESIIFFFFFQDL